MEMLLFPSLKALGELFVNFQRYQIIIILLFSSYPTAKVTPERVLASQGTTIEVRCDATGSPPPLIKWTKLHSPDNANFEQIGPILRIRNAQFSDRGVYVCVASNVHGLVQNSTTIEITSM